MSVIFEFYQLIQTLIRLYNLQFAYLLFFILVNDKKQLSPVSVCAFVYFFKIKTQFHAAIMPFKRTAFYHLVTTSTKKKETMIETEAYEKRNDGIRILVVRALASCFFVC